jgi:nitroimidazol reductase NimA-like FMN-containing flavoprotein (pyridoxamine 5'-phosphate oxidase superfamily)
MVRALTEVEMNELLARALYGHLGCQEKGRTYVIPISFALDGDRLVGITTPGRKIEMMRKNPEVCLCIDDIQDLTNWRSVVLWGTYSELKGIDAATATGFLIDKYGLLFQDMDSSARRGRNVTPDRMDGQTMHPIVYAISITERTGRLEETKPTAATVD